MASLAGNGLAPAPNGGAKLWFFVNHGRPDGPHEADRLVQLYIQRAINDDTLVWTGGEPQWRALGSFATLTEHVRLILSGPARKRPCEQGIQKISSNFRKWLKDLDEHALMGILFKALKWYHPQVVQGHEAARDTLIKPWLARQPSGATTPPETALATLLTEMKSPQELWVAVRPLHVDAAEELIESAAILDANFCKQVQAIWEIGWLWKLLEKGAVDTLVPTLKTKPEVLHMKNAKGRTLLHTAALNNNLEFVKRCSHERLLVPQLVNASDAEGNTPLHLAVDNGHEQMVAELLRIGALVNLQNRDSSLYANGWQVTGNGTLGGPTAAPPPTTSGGAAYKDADSMQNSFFRHSSLPTSGAGGSLNNIGALLPPSLATPSLPTMSDASRGHSAMFAANNHNTPVHIAAERGNSAILEELLRMAPNLSLRNAYGMTPLHCAMEGEDAICVELLLTAGADPSGVASSSRGDFTTPLHWAASHGNTRIVSLLLRMRKAEVNLSNGQGWTPLQLAARKGSVQCVKLLLEAGANPHAKTQTGRTALELAQANNRTDVVPVLEEYCSRKPQESSDDVQ